MANVLSAVEAKKQKARLGFLPHPAQQQISDAMSKYRYVVVRAGRRFGKSSLALNIVLREAFNNPGRYWIVAPSYKQAKTIYWHEEVKKFIPEALIVRKNDQELIVEIRSRIEGKTAIIEFKGSDQEDSLRGAGLKGVVLDEFAFQKETVWEKIIQPMILETRGWAMFITTPNGVGNHFKKFWDDAVAAESRQNDINARKLYEEEVLEAAHLAGQKRKPSDKGFDDWLHQYKTFHFTSYDSPRITPEDIDAKRRQYTEEYFTQEYLAEFAKFTGLIYTGFDPERHIQEFEINEDWTFYRSIDFGATDPNAVSFIGVDKDGVNYIFDEIYINNIYTSELAELIKQKSAHRYFVATYADSAAKQSIMDLGFYGIPGITPVKKNQAAKETGSREWIVAGIDRVHQLLKEDKIIVHARCKNTIKEFQSYSWRKDRGGDPVNLPSDTNNHLLDEIRYYVMMKNLGEEFMEEDFNYLGRTPVDSTVGY